MGRIINSMQGGLHTIQGFADRRDTKKKVHALYVLTIFSAVRSPIISHLNWGIVYTYSYGYVNLHHKKGLSLVSAIWMLVELSLLSFVFDLIVAGLGLLGFTATRRRQRSLLLVVRSSLPCGSAFDRPTHVACAQYVLGMSVVVGLSLLGLVLSILFSVLSFSIAVAYLVLSLVLISIQGLSVILAYSLSKDLDPKRVGMLFAPSPHTRACVASLTPLSAQQPRWERRTTGARWRRASRSLPSTLLATCTTPIV